MRLIHSMAAALLLFSAPVLSGAGVIWVEGEEARNTSFSPGVAPLSDGRAAGASGGLYLKNDRADASGKEAPRFAEYEFKVAEPGSYRLWIASTPLVTGWASPYSIGWLDRPERTDMAGKKYRGVPYGRGKNEQFFFWHDAGTRDFPAAGTYTLRIETGKPRASDSKVVVFIDALALTSDLNELPAGNSPAGSPGALPAPPKGTLVWREAELPDESNLGVRANVPFLNEKGQGASGGMYFNIDRKTDAEKAPEGYYAQYDFNIPAPGAYHVWIAATPFNAGWASPCSIRWDDEPAIDLAGRRPYSPPYGFDHPRAYFFWTKAGVKNFTKAGKHTLRVIADRPRGNTDNIRVFLDAIALTADPAWAPRGNRPPGSPWKGVPKGATPEERKANFRKAIYDIQMQTYPAKLAETNEEWNPETTAEVLRKMKARPLPAPSAIGNRKQLRFGLHGIEKPFVQAGADEERTAAALDLLARAGVEFLRTAEPCWHRLGNVPGTFDYRQLDYEMSLARKHGMKLMLTMGFAPAQYGKGRGNKLAACKPEYYGLYRDYLDDLFRHVPEEMIHSVELANEVDASHVWWVGDSTPEDYVEEAKMTCDALKRAYPNRKFPFLGFSATWSSVERDRAEGRGRAWVERAFDAGADRCFDAYSLHYTWSPPKWGFADWMRAERAKRGFAPKPLHNSEESCYGHPGDLMKLFARNLFLQDMESVTYFLARDFQEVGNLLYSGLFDLNWQPKLRLLAYAASTDAMRGRKLVGMADPATGLEAYVLEKESDDAYGPRYAIVGWALDRAEEGMHSSQKAHSVNVSGWRGVREAVNWRLDPVPPNSDGSITIPNEPLTVYADELPEWWLLTPKEWRERKVAVTVRGQDAGILPGQALPDGR
ncbi:hypothetical protein KH017_07360 [bacterium]|nr:hypothetical protein [bacterium]